SDLICADLDRAGRNLRIHGLRVSQDNRPGYGDDVFRPQLFGLSKSSGVIRICNDLENTGSVSQIDKEETPQVANPIHPSHYRQGLTNMLFRNLAAVTRSLQLA